MNIIEVMKKFSTQKDCIDYLEKVRWGGSPICPYCSNMNTYKLIHDKRYRHHCNNCRKSFSVTVGTIFHDTRLPLQKWFLAITLILNAKKGISSCQLARDIQVQQRTAWSMGHRIRKAMQHEEGELLQGIVEMDETYIGGKPRKTAKKDDDDSEGSGGNPRGRGTTKTPVVGMVERQGDVKAVKADKRSLKSKDINKMIEANIDTQQSILISDEYKGYHKVSELMEHQTINHQLAYVKGDIHTNTIEGFWSILKRGITGQFHHISKKYMNKYLDEFCWRYNQRKNKGIFDNLVGNMLQYAR